jgi:hypothetical protein
MTREETAELLALITAFWPEFVHQGHVTVNAWHLMLADIPAAVAREALVLLAATRSFPPRPADLLDAVAELTLPPDARLSPAEAWGLVLETVRAVGYYREPNLPGIVGQAVRIIGWREICTSENVEATRAHFLRVYEQLQRRARRDAVLPAPLRERLALDRALAPSPSHALARAERPVSLRELMQTLPAPHPREERDDDA